MFILQHKNCELSFQEVKGTVCCSMLPFIEAVPVCLTYLINYKNTYKGTTGTQAEVHNGWLLLHNSNGATSARKCQYIFAAIPDNIYLTQPPQIFKLTHGSVNI